MVWSNVRWSPLSELARVSQELAAQPTPAQARRARAPQVDLWSDAEGLVLEAELPGLNEDSVELKLEPGLLTLSGDWPSAPADEQHRYHRRERHQGRFERRFRLSPEIDLERVEANMQHGVLQVRLPKRSETRERQIPIQGAPKGASAEGEAASD